MNHNAIGFALNLILLILPALCVAQTHASVEEMLKAANANKSPGISLMEGAVQGFGQAQESAPSRMNQVLEIQRQQENLRRAREDQVAEADSQPEQHGQARSTSQNRVSPYSVQGLMERCRQGDAYSHDFCDGFISAWMGMALLVGLDDMDRMRKTICLPVSGAADSQIRAVFIQWAEKNPSKWHLDASYPLADALSDAFPCPKEKKSKKKDAPVAKETP